MWNCEMESISPGLGPEKGFYEYDNKDSGFINRRHF